MSFITPINLAGEFLAWGVRITFTDGTVKDVISDRCTEVLATRVCELVRNHWRNIEPPAKWDGAEDTIKAVIDALRVGREYTVATIHGGTDTGIFRSSLDDILDDCAFVWEEVYDAADELPGRNYDFGSTFYEDFEEDEVEEEEGVQD